VPFQIPPAAVSRFRFRLWNRLSNPQDSEMADGNVPFQIPPFRKSAICVISVTGGSNMIMQIQNLCDLVKPNIKKSTAFGRWIFCLLRNIHFIPYPVFLVNLIQKRTPIVSDRCPLILTYNTFTSSS